MGIWRKNRYRILKWPFNTEIWTLQTNIDWAGLAVERISGLTLNDYFHKNIFEPLGIKNVSMFPTEEMMKNLVSFHFKHPDGTVTEQDHCLRRSLQAKTPEERAHIMNSGGAGCFAKPVEYCRKSSLSSHHSTMLGLACRMEWLMNINPSNRNPRHPPQQRHLAQDGREDPVPADRRHHVHQQHPAMARLCPPGRPRRKAPPDQPHPRALPGAGQPAAGLGPDVHADELGWQRRAVEGPEQRQLGGYRESVLLGR